VHVVGVMAGREMDKACVAAVALDQSADGRPIMAPNYEVPFPVPGHVANADVFRPRGNTGGRSKSNSPTVWLTMALAHWPTCPEVADQSPVQAAPSGKIESLVEGLGTKMPLRSSRVRRSEVSGDLFRTPIELELFGNYRSELGIFGEPGLSRALGPLA